MDSLDSITRFLGWCSVINIGILGLAALAVATMRGMMTRIHGKLSGLGEGDLERAYFQYLAQYKIALFVFNLVPYFALRISEGL
ncbi:MAG: hypothetical protein GY910_12380 [bacterium]|nr:hypothetical protein [Deltaproteobacteria bacterium]MCP4905767.1 hypothetical protein [bacterium]